MSSTDWDLLSSYGGLLSLACFSICVGAAGSLPSPPNTDEKRPHELEDEEEIEERLSSSEAWLFPVTGSVALFGLYAVIMYGGTEWVNWLLMWYFAFADAASVSQSLVSLATYTVGRTRWRQFHQTRLTLKKGSGVLLDIGCRTPTLILVPLGVIPSVLYIFSASDRRSVFLTDLLALSFSHNALSLLKLDSFKTGIILLAGLFFYDIWWVFGTEVMVKVATSLDVPIKLLWPKSLAFSSERGFTMLGLGDVVIPGTFVALALRFDHYRHKKSSISAVTNKFYTPYFNAAIFAYVAGLVTTMTVMHVFHAAQPALLYLSPACIMSFLLTALYQGELSMAWRWTDEAEESEAKKDDKKPEAAAQLKGVSSEESKKTQ